MSFITAPIAALGGALLGGIGSTMQGESNAQASQYNAAVAQRNAVIARDQGEAAAQAQQRAASRQMGSMLANYGASGVQTDSGSPLDVLADSARMAALDNLTIKYNAALRAAGYESESTLENARAKTSRTSGILGAGSNILRGYSMFTQMGSASGGATAAAGGAANSTSALIGDFGMEDLAMLAVG